MNIDNWANYRKLEGPTNRVRSNLLYTPKINPEMTVWCMSWDVTDPYQYDPDQTRPFYTAELVDYFFQRELKYIDMFKHHAWAPKYIDIDIPGKKIFFESPGTTCNDIIYGGWDLTRYTPDWKLQMFNILDDLLSGGVYKASLYPHCFFIKDGILKTFDFYGCVDTAYPFLKKERLNGMVGTISTPRFKEAEEGDSINFEIFFKRILQTHVKWPENAFEEYYSKKYE
jgi:hypothetical protein